MFITIKSKVSSTLMNTVTLAILILVSYLAKHIVVLYQKYQKAETGLMGTWGSSRR